MEVSGSKWKELENFLRIQISAALSNWNAVILREKPVNRKVAKVAKLSKCICVTFIYVSLRKLDIILILDMHQTP
jgi:hypothetical protein